jgi:hypothetical protein
VAVLLSADANGGEHPLIENVVSARSTPRAQGRLSVVLCELVVQESVNS